MSLRQFVPTPFRAPWSHTPGIEGWLSGSSCFAKIFPRRLEIYSCVGKEKVLSAQIFFPKLSYSDDWTVFFDSLRYKTIVQGHSENGFFRYEISVDEKGIFLQTLKGDLECEGMEGYFLLTRGEKHLLVESVLMGRPYPTSRLHLGSNRAPCLDRMLLKPDLLELVPFWYMLGKPVSGLEGESSLLTTFEQVGSFDSLMQFFLAGIQGFFVPKVRDDRYLGFQEPLLPSNKSLSSVHDSVASVLRSYFLKEEGSHLFLLPNLPKECESGRLLREQLHSSSLISIEWRKHTLRRVLIHQRVDEEVTLVTPHACTTYTLQTLGTKEKRHVSSGCPITLKGDERYLFDHFSH